MPNAIRAATEIAAGNQYASGVLTMRTTRICRFAVFGELAKRPFLFPRRCAVGTEYYPFPSTLRTSAKFSLGHIMQRKVFLLLVASTLLYPTWPALHAIGAPPSAATNGRYLTLDAGTQSDGTYSVIVVVSGGRVSVQAVNEVVALTPINNPTPNPNTTPTPPPTVGNYSTWVTITGKTAIPTNAKNLKVAALSLALVYRQIASSIDDGSIADYQSAIEGTSRFSDMAITLAQGDLTEWTAFRSALGAYLLSQYKAGGLQTVADYSAAWKQIATGLEQIGNGAALSPVLMQLILALLPIILQWLQTLGQSK